jgi:hypothetical protein
MAAGAARRRAILTGAARSCRGGLQRDQVRLSQPDLSFALEYH